MLISLMQSVPIIDADCAGRAVPGLDTVLAALLGCPTAPIAMADVYDNRIDLLPVNAYDAEMIEKLALPIVSSFKQNAGIAGWLCNKEMVKTTMVQHSISKALKIGELISSIKSKDQAIRLFDELRRLGLANARTLTKPSKIEDFKVDVYKRQVIFLRIFLIGFISESRKALLMYARLLILSLFTV